MLKTATEQDCQEGEWSKQYIGGDTALQLTNNSKKVWKNQWLLILQQFYADSWQRGGTKCYYNKLSITVDRRQKTAKLPPVNLITYYTSQSDIWHPGNVCNTCTLTRSHPSGSSGISSIPKALWGTVYGTREREVKFAVALMLVLRVLLWVWNRQNELDSPSLDARLWRGRYCGTCFYRKVVVCTGFSL